MRDVGASGRAVMNGHTGRHMASCRAGQKLLWQAVTSSDMRSTSSHAQSLSQAFPCRGRGTNCICLPSSDVAFERLTQRWEVGCVEDVEGLCKVWWGGKTCHFLDLQLPHADTSYPGLPIFSLVRQRGGKCWAEAPAYPLSVAWSMAISRSPNLLRSFTAASPPRLFAHR